MKYLIIAVILLVAFQSFSQNQQNLVPNHSFEKLDISCQFISNGLHIVDNWIEVFGSPDYYSTCSPYPNWMVPQNDWGYEHASISDTSTESASYTGFALWALHIPNGREFIGVSLDDTLQKGKKYKIKFEISLADSAWYAVANFGTLVSLERPPNSLNYLLSAETVVNMNAANEPIDRKDGWKTLEGTYIASGGEKFITIGNFEDDQNTLSAFVPNGGAPNPSFPEQWKEATYYFDNVYLTLDSPLVGINDLNLEQPFGLYPNPAKDLLYLKTSLEMNQSSEYKLELFTLIGERVLSQVVHNSETTVDISNLSSGVYYYQIVSRNKRITSGKQIITR